MLSQGNRWNFPRWRLAAILDLIEPESNSAIRPAYDENHTLEPNMKWIGSPVAEIMAIRIFQDGGRAAILNLFEPEMAPSSPPTSKTPPTSCFVL